VDTVYNRDAHGAGMTHQRWTTYTKLLKFLTMIFMSSKTSSLHWALTTRE